MFKTSLLLCCLLLNSMAYATTLNAFNTKLASLKGKIVYVDFWASWCSPCRRSFPWLIKLQHQYQAQQFTVLSINVDSNKQFADQFISNMPINFPVLYDTTGELMHALNINSMPSSLLIDRNGKVIASHHGFNPQKQQAYQRELQTLLQASKPSSKS